MYKNTEKCRMCGSSSLINILNLGEQYLTGVFPKSKDSDITKGPLDLIWCSKCSLLQLKQSYSLSEMYGDNYGYRSSLNQSMVSHLQKKVIYLEHFCPLSPGDVVLDIGSSDATTLKSYSKSNITKVGVDPVGEKYRKYYTEDIELIPDFFPSINYDKQFSGKKAKIITCIAMFYDLESPRDFVCEIAKNLDDDGIWHFEQHYMPSMLRTNAYDTICHEHLEYYSLRVVKPMLEEYGLKILDIQINDINGGSFAITACHSKSKIFAENRTIVEWLLLQEERMGINILEPYCKFEQGVFEHRANLIDLLVALNNDGKKIIGYGASTKGNVLLQFCGITENEIPFIAEVNEDKFGCFTPGTNIPIIPEKDARAMNPDYFFVLPWHFKNNILSREQEFISKGGKFIFPLPYIEIV